MKRKNLLLFWGGFFPFREDPFSDGVKTSFTKLPPLKLYLFAFFFTLTLVMLNKDAMPTSDFQPIRLLDPDC